MSEPPSSLDSSFKTEKKVFVCNDEKYCLSCSCDHDPSGELKLISPAQTYKINGAKPIFATELLKITKLKKNPSGHLHFLNSLCARNCDYNFCLNFGGF